MTLVRTGSGLREDCTYKEKLEEGNMNINFYVKRDYSDSEVNFKETLTNWITASNDLEASMNAFLKENV